MNVMRTTVATVVAATLSMSAFSVFAAASLTGAGATFPAPVYAKWADTYNKETGNKVNYQGIGSSGGVKQITANTVDFGASDAPLTDDKLAQEGLFQFPTVIGGVVLANSEFRHQIEAEIRPFKGILMGLFFMTVGMSIDMTVLASQWLPGRFSWGWSSMNWPCSHGRR